MINYFSRKEEGHSGLNSLHKINVREKQLKKPMHNSYLQEKRFPHQNVEDTLS